MLTLRYLLLIAASVGATTAAALAALNSIQATNPYTKSVAMAVSAISSAKTKEPVGLTPYRVYYSLVDGRWVLTDKPIGAASPPLYAVGIGLCGDITPLLYKTYTQSNNTLHATQCSYVLPTVDGDLVTHYLPLCREGTDFAAEAAELEVEGWRIRMVIVKC
ncbi:MAG: hypothetical protein ABWK05_08450 [Pyrobaculum sp.]